MYNITFIIIIYNKNKDAIESGVILEEEGSTLPLPSTLTEDITGRHFSNPRIPSRYN